MVELNVQGEECYDHDFKQKENVVYLFENNYYLFKFNLMTYNKNLFNTFDSSLLRFTTTASSSENRDTNGTNSNRGSEKGESLLRLVKHKQNYYVYKAMKLGCSYYELSYGLNTYNNNGSNSGDLVNNNNEKKEGIYTKDNQNLHNQQDKLVHKYKLCVLEQVKLPGYECNKKMKLPNNYEYSVCEKPLVVSVGDVFRLSPKGGSGNYKYEVDGCYNEGNKFVCTEKGSYQLKIVDANNEENGLVLQLVSTTVSSSKFKYLGLSDNQNQKGNQEYNTTNRDKDNKEGVDKTENTKTREELNVRVNKGLKVRLSLYGDLSGFKPMFKNRFTKEDTELYSFNYAVSEESNLVASVNDLDRLEALYSRFRTDEGSTEGQKGEYENMDTNSNNENRREMYKQDLKLLSYDKRVLELRDYEKDTKGALVVTFVAVSVNTTRLEVNTQLLLNMYNKDKQYQKGNQEYGKDDSDRVYLDENEFKRLLVNVYKDPVLYVNERYKLPVINLSSVDKMKRNEVEEYKNEDVLANVALGSKVELNYKFGLKGNKPKLRNKSNNNVLYVENLENNMDSNNEFNKDNEGQGFMVYCVNVGQEEVLFELLDYSKVYKITCSIPRYNRLYPLNKLSSDLYELVDHQDYGHLGLQGLGADKKSRYMVNVYKTNRYVNLLYDSSNNLLLASNLYQSTFHLYEMDNNTKKETKNMERMEGSVFEFDFGSFTRSDKEKNSKEFMLLGSYKYLGNSDYYSEKFNKLYKYRKFNQLIVNSLKNNYWEYKNKQLMMSNQVYLVPRNNHGLLLQREEDRKYDTTEQEKNVYVMYNKLFVYKLYVHGGTGRYTLTTNASDFKYTFSNLYSFPEHLSRLDKEKMVEREEDREEVLPVSMNDRKEVVVNLFDYGSLKGNGRFLTFSTNNVNDLVLNVKDEGLLWQDTVHLKLHFRNPNKFELLVSPFEVKKDNNMDSLSQMKENKDTNSNDSKDNTSSSVVSVKEDKEELLYLEDNYRVKLKGYYNGNRLMSNSLLLAFRLLNNNLGLRILNGSKVHLHNLQENYEYEGQYDDNNNNLQLFFKGEDELVLNTLVLGSSGLVVSDMDGNLKRTYRFKVINKLLLNFNNVTVLPETYFDVTFKNLSNYNNLKVSTTAATTSSSDEGVLDNQKQDKLVHNYSLGFKQLGLYKYNVNVMYNNNQLTELKHKLVVNVSKPTRMSFHLSALYTTNSRVLGLSNENKNMDSNSGINSAEKENKKTKESKERVNKTEQVVSDDNLFEYVVDRDAVVNLNVLLFDQDNNMFTPLYLNNNNLEFEYKLSESCRLVDQGYGGMYQFYSGLGLDGFVGSANFDSKSVKEEMVYPNDLESDFDNQENLKDSRSDKSRVEVHRDNNMQQRYRNQVVVTNKYNVLLSVSNNCDVVVTSKYNGVLLQSKKLKFKVKIPDRLFGGYEGYGSNLFKDNVGFVDREFREGRLEDNRGFGQCRDDDENLCFGGVYEVKRVFKSYPDNKLKELGNNLYKVSSLGSVMLTTENNVYNVKVLKPTHFSLVQLNTKRDMVDGNLGLYHGNNDYNYNNLKVSTTAATTSSSSGKYQSHGQVDFVSYNMSKLMFKVVLFSNNKRLKMPINGRFSVRMKDLSVFTYELEGDLLTLTPHKVGQTVVELVYSLSTKRDSNSNRVDKEGTFNRKTVSDKLHTDEDNQELKLLYQDEHRLNRVYFVRSGRYELTNMYNVMLGSQVYLTGSRVNGVEVNLDANSYEFQKFLKNKYTVKTYETSCFGFECGVSYVNKNDYLNDVNKLKHLVNLNRTSYKVLLNVVTNALNTLFSYSNEYFGYQNVGFVDREFGDVNEMQNVYARKKLFNMNNLSERYLCRNNYCWLQLNYTLKNPVSLNQVNQANQMLYNYYDNNNNGSGGDLEDVEEVMRMLSSPLLGVDNTMWNTGEGVVKDMKVNNDRLGTYKFKNVNNEQVVTNVVRFDPTHYKFRQLDPSTLVLLPYYPNMDKKEITTEQLVKELDKGVFGNHGNVLYYNYGLNYHFKDPQLNKLYFLKLTYSPHLVYSSNSSRNKKGRKEQNKGDMNDKVDKDNKEDEKLNNKTEQQYGYRKKTGRLVYRLGYKMLLVNSSNKEWSVLKNHLRTMSADLLKGKHKLNLQLYYSYGENKDTNSKDNSNKENRKELLEQELEVDLPESVVFVNSEGYLVNELNESSLNHVLHVYPVSSSYKLHLTSNNYVIKTIERSGQLATFILYSNENGDNSTTPANNNKLLFNMYNKRNKTFDNQNQYKEKQDNQNNKFVGNNYLMVLNSSNHVVGRIKITADLPSSTFSLGKFNFLNNRSLSDVVLLGLTLVVLVFFFFVYNTLRNHHYYQPTVPIKLERTLPKAFDHLQQTRYHYRYHPH